MALRTKEGCRYGDNHADIHVYFAAFSRANGDIATHFADCVCAACGKDERRFIIGLDEIEEAATRTCAVCGAFHAIGDSADYLNDAKLADCQCPCGAEIFEASVGVALYAGSDDVRHFYLGLRCIACGLVACYGEWASECGDYHALLEKA